MRYDLVQIHKQLNPELKSGDLCMYPPVHDELNFSVKADRFHDLIPRILGIMQVEVAGWEIPMDVGMEVGDSWGTIHPFENVNNEWRPKK